MTALPMMALVKRELISTLRQTRSFVFLVLFAAGMSTFVMSLWPREGMPFAAVATSSAFLLQAVFWTARVACFVLIPPLAAASITNEKETRSLDMLRMTLISPSGIVIAKLINAAGFMVLLVVAALPVVGVVLFLVGVDWVEVLEGFLALIAQACECAAMGIMCATLFRTTYRAVIYSYLGLFLAWFFVATLGVSMFWLIFSLGSTGPAGPGSALFLAATGIYRWAFPWALTAFCLFVAASRLRRGSLEDKHETRKPVDKPSELAARRLRFPFYLIDPLKRKKAIEDGRNPLYVRELRWGQICSAKTLVRFGYSSVLLFILMAIFHGIAYSYTQPPHSIGRILHFHMIFVALVGPAVLAGAFTRELENDTLDTLRMTTLTPDELVTGKLYAGMAALAPVLGASLLTSLAMVAVVGLTWESLTDFVTGYVSLGVCVLLAVAVGLLASVLTKRTTVATVLGYGLALLFFVGGSAIAAWLDAALGVSDVSSGIGERFSPLFAYGAHLYDRTGNSVLTRDWAANVLVFGTLGYGMIEVARRQFAARLRREE
ncbi:MAG: ABC transporter permease subunit [Thermodesulfobacteriota bacterium]